MIGRRRGGMSLGRVAKKAAVATVVNRVVNNALDGRIGNDTSGMQQHVQPQTTTVVQVCPSCQSRNPDHAKFCLNCGGGFAAPQSAPQQATKSNNCSGCKANLMGITGNFCPYCRSPIG